MKTRLGGKDERRPATKPSFRSQGAPPEEDAKENKKKAVRELILVAIVLFLIFVVFLPQFIDYGQVIDSMMKLSIQRSSCCSSSARACSPGSAPACTTR